MNCFRGKVAVHFMITVLMAVWYVLPICSAAAAPEPEDNRAGVLAQQAEKLIQALQHEAQRDSFDPRAVVDNVGRDPGKLFAWVKAETRLVPYRGVLRGAQGALMDRQCNSLDRALLLADLLQHAGSKSRLCQATLPLETAQKLAADVLGVRPQGNPPGAASSAAETVEEFSKFAQSLGIDPAPYVEDIHRGMSEADAQAQTIRARVSQQLPAITASLPSAAADSVDARMAAAAQMFQDHWWVQCQIGAEWIDLDPSLPSHQPGTALVPAEKQLEVKELPADVFHTAGIHVLSERMEADGKLVVETLLTQELRACDAFGNRIVLRHVPVDQSRVERQLKEVSDTAGVIALVRSVEEWVPLLSVGSTTHFELAVNNQGVARKHSFSSSGGLLSGATGLLSSGMEAVSGPQDSQTGQPQTVLTAEWLEYQICVPGQPARMIRRQIFDLLGPARRSEPAVAPIVLTPDQQATRALAQMGAIDILIAPCELSPDFANELFAESFLGMTRTLRPAEQKEGGAAADLLVKDIARLRLQCGPLYSLALARAVLPRDTAAHFIAQPNVFAYHAYYELKPPTGLVSCRAFDIVWNRVAPRPGVSNAFMTAVEQGVVDTNAEAVLLGSSPCHTVRSAADFFAQTPTAWQLLSAPADVPSQIPGCSPDARARMVEDLQAGYLVLAPPEAAVVDGAPLMGWWRIDRETGHTLGVLHNGWGAAISERAVFNVLLTFTLIDYLVCKTLIVNPVEDAAGYCGAQMVCDLFMAISAVAGVGLAKVIIPCASKTACTIFLNYISDGLQQNR